MNRSLKPETIWTLALVGVGLLFIASLGLAFMPKPTTSGVEASKRKQLKTVLASIANARTKQAQIETATARRLWNEDAQTIGARALATVSATAKASGLKLTAFRPQRQIDSKGLTQLPYLVFAEGPYPKVLGFVARLESPAVKLAINSVQIASSDGASDRVRTSITVVAFKKT